MPEYMKSTPYSRGGWFEEDVDWCLPVVVFETEFREKPSQFVREDAHLEAFKYEYHSERRAQWEGGAR
jgi:hypothetical protein